jgi:hypothetical protein
MEFFLNGRATGKWQNRDILWGEDGIFRAKLAERLGLRAEEEAVPETKDSEQERD